MEDISTYKNKLKECEQQQLKLNEKIMHGKAIVDEVFLQRCILQKSLLHVLETSDREYLDGTSLKLYAGNYLCTKIPSHRVG
jgi:hypothetical protein